MGSDSSHIWPDGREQITLLNRVLWAFAPGVSSITILDGALNE
jgi:hypothetical protein